MTEFSQFREINNRLKKRFNLIRKPNLKEASESYRKLSNQLSSFPNYSGYCMYSAAKCEHQIVGSLKEQLNQSLSSSASSMTSVSTNRALKNLVNEAIWTEFQTWLDAARIFRETDIIENDINGAISSYAHAIQICPSPRILTIVLGELASLYIKYHRFYEAAEVYIEASLYREAIDCLIRGHFYQDAYYCYQEMFKKQPNFENYTNLTDSAGGNDLGSLKMGSSNQIPNDQQKSSILSLFKKKQQSSSRLEDINEDKKNCGENPKNQFDSLKSFSPFNFSEKNLTIDDYINFFLLRLYLYDPVKYEYPSPIIPIPKQYIENFDNDNQEDEESGHKLKHSLLTQELSLPFFDMINSRWMDRSIIDVIELNHLLETLYLSYRNELRASIDNEYSDFDIIQHDSVDEISKQEKSEECLKLRQCDPKADSDSEETECADDSSSSGHLTSTHYDSKDSSDDDQQQFDNKYHSNGTSFTAGSTNSALKLLEAGELDDISARLERLAQKLSNFKDSKKSTSEKINKTEEIEYRVRKKIEQIESKWVKTDTIEESDCGLIFTNDDEQLRQQIVRHLYPLLNGNQVQLLYDILEEKD